MRKYIVLHEGECEKSVIEWLKKQGYQFGVSYKIVLSDSKKIERVLNMIGKKTNVIVIARLLQLAHTI